MIKQEELRFLKALFAGTQIIGFCFLECTLIIGAVSAFMCMIAFSGSCDVNNFGFLFVMRAVAVCCLRGDSQWIGKAAGRSSRRDEAECKHQEKGK